MMTKPFKNSSRQRRQGTLRSRGSARVRTRFSFACEGSIEVNYLKQIFQGVPFRDSLAVVAKPGKKPDIRSLIKKARELEDDPGVGEHHVWIICDRDFRPDSEKQELQKWLDGNRLH